MGTWKSKNRHKYLLQYHIIFVCRYRKKLLMSKQISDDIKQFSYEICQKHKAVIRYEELYNISYLGKISELFTKTFPGRAYFLDGRIFSLQCRKCFRRDAPKIYRKPGIER